MKNQVKRDYLFGSLIVYWICLFLFGEIEVANSTEAAKGMEFSCRYLCCLQCHL